jgi:hypothetical protein
MPADRETLASLGLQNGWPAWYKNERIRSRKTDGTIASGGDMLRFERWRRGKKDCFERRDFRALKTDED